jgi:class 3 adenylate cyclase
MPQPEIRKLVAVMSLDVVGYARMMQQDEADTLARVGRSFDELVSRRAEARSGRIVKSMGDGLLLEFSSAIDAVAAGLEIQKKSAEGNVAEAHDQPIIFRIGINLGDIIALDGDIFGDGVNRAARLQEIAEPGGICISAAVHEQVKGKIDDSFRDLGHRKLKNITEPVRVYGTATGSADETDKPAGWPFLTSAKRKPVTAGGCLCGQVRYKVWSQPVVVGFCHCRHCQLALGAPLNAWAIFEKQNVSFEGKPPALYASSALSERAFCGHCGTSLYTDVREAGYYSIRVATLDNPEDFPPELHYGVESQIPWVDLQDDLPRILTEDDPQLSARWVAVGEPKAGPTLPGAEARRDRQGAGSDQNE